MVVYIKYFALPTKVVAIKIELVTQPEWITDAEQNSK